MRIVHLNTYDTIGGAARATYRLHQGLLQRGYQSSILVADRRSQDPTVLAFAPPTDLANRVQRRIRAEWIRRSFSRYRSTLPKGFEKFTDDRTVFRSDLVRQLPRCDIINLHWIAGFVDLRTFFSIIPVSVPIFWRLSDMNPLTGGCHFDDGCGRYVAGCGSCPQLGSADPGDLSRQIWRRKDAVFGRLNPKRLNIIALNRWMAETVRRSPLLGNFPVTIVPNGIDTNVFAPREAGRARDILGIPQDRRVILFAADVVSHRRKGFPLLVQSLHELRDSKNFFLVSVGSGSPQIQTDIPHLHLGHIDDDSQLSLVYSAADVYVIPSLQDNQPNTVLEAMACGTPVVGFEVGGIPEMVRPGVTGLLTPAEDVTALRAATVELLRCSEKRAAMAAACRRIVMDEYTREIQVQRYVALYSAALEDAYSSNSRKTGSCQAIS